MMMPPDLTDEQSLCNSPFIFRTELQVTSDGCAAIGLRKSFCAAIGDAFPFTSTRVSTKEQEFGDYKNE